VRKPSYILAVAAFAVLVAACTSSAPTNATSTEQLGESYKTAVTVPASAIRFQTVTSTKYGFTVAFPVLPGKTNVQASDLCGRGAYSCAYNAAHSYDLFTHLKVSTVDKSGRAARYCFIGEAAVDSGEIFTNCSTGYDYYQVTVVPVPAAHSDIAILLAEAWYNCTYTEPARIGNVMGTACDTGDSYGSRTLYIVIRHGSLYTLTSSGSLTSGFVATFHLY
jgi:hypothetical protein